MASERQIAANQKNAKKSTGPRSKAGREASRRNARRHGLAIAISGRYRDASQTLIAVPKSRWTRARCRQSGVRPVGVRKIRTWLFETLYYDATTTESMVELNDKLAKLERYERRAFSRRRRAMRQIWWFRIGLWEEKPAGSRVFRQRKGWRGVSQRRWMISNRRTRRGFAKPQCSDCLGHEPCIVFARRWLLGPATCVHCPALHELWCKTAQPVRGCMRSMHEWYHRYLQHLL